MPLLLILIVLGCSNPAKRDPAPHGSGPAPTDANPGDAPIDAAPPGAVVSTFPWQQLRDRHAAYMKQPVGTDPCDRRGRDLLTLPGDCRYGSFEVAAKLVRIVPRGDGYLATFDRGADDGVERGWRAALIDSSDRLVTGWATVTTVERHLTAATVPASWLAHETRRNVALVTAGNTAYPPSQAPAP